VLPEPSVGVAVELDVVLVEVADSESEEVERVEVPEAEDEGDLVEVAPLSLVEATGLLVVGAALGAVTVDEDPALELDRVLVGADAGAEVPVGVNVMVWYLRQVARFLLGTAAEPTTARLRAACWMW
jgi:hypothetical protein